eukprot:scaffold1853_cov287-Chaetoceros_neogracile.AAC.9
MFDFYNGGGLDLCFLGAAQVSENGDVNVSRMSKDRLTGPGGFIDISQSTKKVIFLTPMTTKGLQVSIKNKEELQIESEGSVKKFVKSVYEKTFSGDEAVRRGQQVLYVTERAVFRRTAKHPVLELIEIAPGIDLQKDVLDQIDFDPIVSPRLKKMDERIYKLKAMDAGGDLFGSLSDRITYHPDDHTLYLDMFGITLKTADDVTWFASSLRDVLFPLVDEKGPIDMVVNYDGFDIAKGLEAVYTKAVIEIETDMYNSVKRYAGNAFKRAKLKHQMKIGKWNMDKLFDEFDTDQSGFLTREQLRNGCLEKFGISLTPSHLQMFDNLNDFMVDGQDAYTFDDRDEFMQLDRKSFAQGLREVLKLSA